MTITRNSTGKQLYKDFSEYADQAAHDADFNNDEHGRLTLDITNDYVYDYDTTSDKYGDIYNGATYQNLYLRSRAKVTAGSGGNWLAIGLRRSTSSGSCFDSSNSMYFILLGYNANMQMVKVVNGDVIVIVGDTASGIDPTAAEFDLVFIANSTALEAFVNGTSKMSTADSDISAAGYIEMFDCEDIQCYFTDICVCSSPDITCSGLPTGYKFRVTDRDSNTAVATESGGTATVAGKTLIYPGDKVEVLNASDSVVETYNLPGDVWGGDAYAYSALMRRFVQFI